MFRSVAALEILDLVHDPLGRMHSELLAEDLVAPMAMIGAPPAAHQGHIPPPGQRRHGLPAPVLRQVNQLICRERQGIQIVDRRHRPWIGPHLPVSRAPDQAGDTRKIASAKMGVQHLLERQFPLLRDRHIRGPCPQTPGRQTTTHAAPPAELARWAAPRGPSGSREQTRAPNSSASRIRRCPPRSQPPGGPVPHWCNCFPFDSPTRMSRSNLVRR